MNISEYYVIIVLLLFVGLAVLVILEQVYELATELHRTFRSCYQHWLWDHRGIYVIIKNGIRAIANSAINHL